MRSQRPDTWSRSLSRKLNLNTPLRHKEAGPFRADVGFSNRPFRVKRFQTIHHLGVNVARGLVLLFGIGTKALPSWDSKTRWNNLLGGLAVSLTGGQADMRTHLIHRPARDIFPPIGGARVFSYRI